MEVIQDEILFIIVGNDDWIISENIKFIDNMTIPKHMKVEYRVVSNLDNIPQTVQNAMRESMAKYKIYLDQNVFLLDKEFLTKAIAIFQNNPDIGLLGARGYYKTEENEKMELRGNYIFHYNDTRNICLSNVCEGGVNTIVDVMALDKHFMMTSVDSDWNGNNSNFHIIKSVEMRHAGYRTVVFIDEKPFVLFDNGIALEQ